MQVHLSPLKDQVEYVYSGDSGDGSSARTTNSLGKAGWECFMHGQEL
jgi:hypothetical protein